MSGKKQQPKKPAKRIVKSPKKRGTVKRSTIKIRGRTALVPAIKGRPAFEPTADQRQQVKAMVGYGIPVDDVCRMIINPDTKKGINKRTLRKHFEEEISTGRVVALTKVAETLYQQAIGRTTIIVDGETVQEGVKPNVACLMFFLKCRGGWKETSVHEHSGPDGGPIEHEHDLTDAERSHRITTLLERGRTRRTRQADTDADGDMESDTGSTE